MPDLKARHWAFTLNNYTQEDVDRLSNLDKTEVTYIVFGKEVGESGTEHLQGHVYFEKQVRLSRAIQTLGQCHLSQARDVDASIEYCMKEGNFVEFGVRPRITKKRKVDKLTIEERMDAFKEAVNDGMTDMFELRESHTIVCAKFPAFVKQYIDDVKQKNIPKVKAFPLRSWQQELYESLLKPADDRRIIFVVDIVGNSGKSWFARYFCDYHGNGQIVVPGKKADMALTIDETKKVFFFDCPRSKQGEFIQYDFLEELKNGLILSPKYESKMKRLETPHVVVLMNERPDEYKLSNDRYHIITLKTNN
jgi:hypothetical protein